MLIKKLFKRDTPPKSDTPPKREISSKHKMRYLPLDDIKELDDAFLGEMEIVKRRFGFVKDETAIKVFQEVLLDAYKAAIEMKVLEREVDYDVKVAEIKARKRALKPWRRCWLWRLLFQPLTNRAQDIIEERAELDAEYIHTAAENAIKELKAAIKKADAAEPCEVLAEPSEEPTEPGNVNDVAPMGADKPAQVQPQAVPTRRPRPPRSCRRPRT